MRVADKMAFDQVTQNVSKNRTQMAELQNQAATQKKVTRPSDDPVSAARILSNRVDLQGSKQFVKNLNYAKSFLEFSDQTLGEIGETLVRAKELAIGQASDAGANETSRKITATEIEQLFNQVVQLGNRKLGNRFIFGGFKTTDSPFDSVGRYRGDSGEMLIHTDKESFVTMNIPGNKVFHGDGLDRDGVIRQSKEQARTIEEFLADQSASENPQKMDQKNPSSSGESSSIEVRGPASVSPNSKILSSSVENTDLENGGSAEESEWTPPSAGVNLFSVLKDLEISLRTNDKEGVQGTLTDLDKALDQVVLARAQVGSRSMALASLNLSLEKSKVDSAVMISQLEDADIFKTVSDMNKTENTLNATLQTSGKLIQKSLLDFMR